MYIHLKDVNLSKNIRYIQKSGKVGICNEDNASVCNGLHWTGVDCSLVLQHRTVNRSVVSCVEECTKSIKLVHYNDYKILGFIFNQN